MELTKGADASSISSASQAENQCSNLKKTITFHNSWLIDAGQIRHHYTINSARYFVNQLNMNSEMHNFDSVSTPNKLDPCCFKSSPFWSNQDPDIKFIFELYPKGAPGQSNRDYGSLFLNLVPGGPEEQLMVKMRVVVSNGHNFSPQETRNIEGVCGHISRTGQHKSLGWTNEFIWLDLLVTPYGVPSSIPSTNLEVRFDITYTKTGGNQPVKRLLTDMVQLRKRPRFHDVTLCCGQESNRKEFPAHKAILSVRSPVFEAMFTRFEDSTENAHNRVVIEDIEPTMMELLLDHIYTGDTCQVDAYATDLLEAADKYDIQSLVEACIESMLHNMSEENAAKIYYVADLHSLATVRLKAIKFINHNPIAVMATEGWKVFIQPNLKLLEELYVEMSKITTKHLNDNKLTNAI